MSKAVQCDRCHRFFTHPEINDNNECTRLNYTILNQMSEYGNKSTLIAEQDLCPECTKDFRIFMNQPILKKEK